jgi:hypothetical protein
MADSRSEQQNMGIHRSIDVPMYNIYKRLLRAFDIDTGVVAASSRHIVRIALSWRLPDKPTGRKLD